MNFPSPIITSLLSYGMSGEVFHAPLISAHPGFGLKHVLQRKSVSAMEHFPRVKVVKTIDEIINDPEVELVIVNTPNTTHFEFAHKALEAGKHVVVEKPFTVTVDEGQKLIELAKKKSKVLSVFHNRRWDGGFLTVKKILATEMLGKVVEYEARYDRFRNYIAPNTWKENPGPGSGILYNLGSHMLDQVLVLFGMPVRISARIGIQRPGGKADDFYDLRLEYEGLNVIVKSSYLVREPAPAYSLHGVKGSFVKYGLDAQEEALKQHQIPGSPGWGTEPEKFWGKLNTEIDGKPHEGKVETVAGNYLGYYQNIYEAIREGKDLEVKPSQALKVIQLIEAAMRSNQEHKSIAL